MKSCSHIFALITACVFLFCGCSNYLSLSKASSVPYPQTEYDTALKAYRDSLEMPLSPVDAEHGEDAPIVWEDTGMEAAVRLLLNRPEGTISRSDVWNLNTLTITERTMFEGDSGTTTIVTVTAQQGDATLEQEISAVGKESPLPALASLHDLQYFDGLQAFSYSTSPTANQAFTDFSGIETMSHLERFSVNRGTARNVGTAFSPVPAETTLPDRMRHPRPDTSGRSGPVGIADPLFKRQDRFAGTGHQTPCTAVAFPQLRHSSSQSGAAGSDQSCRS